MHHSDKPNPLPLPLPCCSVLGSLKGKENISYHKTWFELNLTVFGALQHQVGGDYRIVGPKLICYSYIFSLTFFDKNYLLPSYIKYLNFPGNLTFKLRLVMPSPMSNQ